ncbi:hypothetical protein [Janthinobacterium sp. JC611]|uniref:hypothetical protein n=1 Tax=Janthinobacterium sp. JC611 TaxID=2816201 RepID=UPI001BFD2D51|nr:hypothetical protein [Janthinobacterium sp. JC611]
MLVESYFPVLLFILIGILVGVVPMPLGRALGPHKPDAATAVAASICSPSSWAVMAFPSMLAIGLAYEWQRGALTWE